MKGYVGTINTLSVARSMSMSLSPSVYFVGKAAHYAFRRSPHSLRPNLCAVVSTFRSGIAQQALFLTRHAWDVYQPQSLEPLHLHTAVASILAPTWDHSKVLLLTVKRVLWCLLVLILERGTERECLLACSYSFVLSIHSR